MGISAAFVSGMSDLTAVPKLTPPLSSTLPNAQSFGQSADSLEKWSADLKAKFEAVKKPLEEYNALYKKWVEFNKSFVNTAGTLSKGVEKYIAQGRNWPQKAYETGCTKIETGLDVIETKRKSIDDQWGPIAVKGG